jgi:hypothetical protein
LLKLKNHPMTRDAMAMLCADYFHCIR